jgi:hypothetical protein
MESKLFCILIGPLATHDNFRPSDSGISCRRNGRSDNPPGGPSRRRIFGDRAGRLSAARLRASRGIHQDAVAGAGRGGGPEYALKKQPNNYSSEQFCGSYDDSFARHEMHGHRACYDHNDPETQGRPVLAKWPVSFREWRWRKCFASKIPDGGQSNRGPETKKQEVGPRHFQEIHFREVKGKIL